MNHKDIRATLWAIKKLNELEDYELMSELQEAIEQLLIKSRKDSHVKQIEEHILKPQAGGTGSVCSCGKNYTTTDEANQHINWNLKLTQNKISEQLLIKVRLEELIEPKNFALRNYESTDNYNFKILANTLENRIAELEEKLK